MFVSQKGEDVRIGLARAVLRSMRFGPEEDAAGVGAYAASVAQAVVNTLDYFDSTEEKKEQK